MNRKDLISITNEQKNVITTTLYDLVAAVREHLGPEKDDQVVGIASKIVDSDVIRVTAPDPLVFETF